MTYMFIPSFQEANWDALIIKSAIILIFWIFMIVSALIDLWTGVQKAKVLGEKPQSRKFRRTVNKIAEYWSVLAMALMLDIIASMLPFYRLPYASMLVAFGCILIELKSIHENHKAKKSGVAKLPDIVKKLAECTDPAKIKELIGELLSIENKPNKLSENE